MCIEKGNPLEGPPLGNKKKQIGIVCAFACVCVCASLFLSRSRLCAFLLQMSEPLLPTCCASVTKYWRRKIIQRFFKTFFNHFSSVRVRRCVSVCNGECSVCVCVCVGLLTLLQAGSKPLALLLGAATTMANYFLFFVVLGKA